MFFCQSVSGNGYDILMRPETGKLVECGVLCVGFFKIIYGLEITKTVAGS